MFANAQQIRLLTTQPVMHPIAQPIMQPIDQSSTQPINQSSTQQPIMQPLPALNVNDAVNATNSTPIRALSQTASQRVSPHVIVLQALTNAEAAALAVPASTQAAALPASSAPAKPLQIGVGRAVPDAADATATARLLTWTQAADGSLRAAISVEVFEARGLRLGLHVVQLPPEAKLRVYAPDAADTIEIAATEVLNTIQMNLKAGDNSAAAHTYWLPIVKGSRGALEIELPAGTDPDLVEVSLPLVSQLSMLPSDDATWSSNLPVLGAPTCSQDVMCTTGRSNEMHAVAKMAYTDSPGSTSLCTGTLLNNTKNDHTPYFLSANHCISTQTVASTLALAWNYRSTICNSGIADDNASDSIVTGAYLLYTNEITDNSLLLLKDTPPANATFADWNAAPVNMGSVAFGIDHPGGELQKYNESVVGATCSQNADYSYSCNSTSGNPFYKTVFTYGMSAGGSSGGPLFINGKVVGQLRGVDPNQSPDCGANYSKPIYYGRFDLAYTNGLSLWLSPQMYTLTLTSTDAANNSSTYTYQVQSGQTYWYTFGTSMGPIASVTGTCGGTWNESTYTTNVITGACTANVKFDTTYTITLTATDKAGNAATWPYQVAAGHSYAFSFDPSEGPISTVTGTCGGSWNGSTYTTGTIAASCSANVQF